MKKKKREKKFSLIWILKDIDSFRLQVDRLTKPDDTYITHKNN